VVNAPPALLGRGVVVDAAQEAPGWWAGVARVEIDDAVLADPSAAVGLLHRAWMTRDPVVVSLGVDPARFRQPRTVAAEPWTLGARFELWEDRLHFLVWANNYDARADPAAPVWWWARKATRLGATAAPVGSPGPGAGDVTLPDGRPAWVDGGPRGGLPEMIDGAVVVHRESVERDRLTVSRPVVSGVAVSGPVVSGPGIVLAGGPPPPPGPLPGDLLAPDQLAAVTHPSGPARIIAPAGSGKTRVLTERLRHLLAVRGWERDAVLAVAYNKKAQEELDARCTGLGSRTRTLNSLGLWLLTAARGSGPRVLDERETRRIVERVAPARRHRANTDPIGPYLEALSTVRLGLVDPDVVEASRDDVPGLAALFPLYRRELAEAGAVDFDEQIYGAIEALLADGTFRQRVQLGCRHLLVDEFQDLTPAHVLLLRLLALPALDVFGVGDDDQVIYGHAGADPAFLIDYEQLFPGARSHPLEVNYRCPPAVVTAAASLLSYNERRVAKVIRADRPEPDPGGPAGLVVRRHAATAGADTLVDVVRGWLDSGVDPSELAVLTRVNSLLLAPQVALAEAGVAMASVLRPDVLDRTGLRAALAYVRIATAEERSVDARDLIEILRRPSRGLPPWFADRLRRRSAWSVDGLRQIAATVPDKDAPKVERLVDDVVAMRAMASGATTDALIRAVRDEIGLGTAMSLLDQSRGAEGSSHLDDLEALEQVAALHPDPATFEPWLRAAFGREADPGGVTLSTVHRVKGMEWDRVVVYGASTGIIPHRLAEDVEEERRVLHVAVTRGREEVVVLADRSRPSPFLAELDGSAPRPAPGSTRRGGGQEQTTDARPVVTRPDGKPAPGRSAPGRSAPGRSAVGKSAVGESAVGTAAPAQPEPEELSPAAAELAERLRSWRRSRSQADKVPPYIVFSDRTLRAIATARPETLPALLAVDGIGPTKLDLYGDELLALVAGEVVSGA
jgi:DNA helicase II / ATP-dependent DNA helicase PcrA